MTTRQRHEAALRCIRQRHLERREVEDHLEPDDEPLLEVQFPDGARR